MHPSATGTYYFQWVYESPNSQDTIDKPDPYGSFYAVVVNSDPPPPEDPEITKFEISNPICDDDEDTEATVSVAFDEKDYPVETSNSPVCIFLVLDGNVNGTEDDGGGALACWSLPSAQSGGNYFTWDDPTKFSKDLDIDGHYGGPGSMPDEIAFKLLLTDDSHNYNVLDQMQKTIPVEACN